MKGSPELGVAVRGEDMVASGSEATGLTARPNDGSPGVRLRRALMRSGRCDARSRHARPFVGLDDPHRLVLTVEFGQLEASCRSCGVLVGGYGRRLHVLHDAPDLGPGQPGPLAEAGPAVPRAVVCRPSASHSWGQVWRKRCRLVRETPASAGRSTVGSHSRSPAPAVPAIGRSRRPAGEHDAPERSDATHRRFHAASSGQVSPPLPYV